MSKWREVRLGQVAPFKYGKSKVAKDRIKGKYKVFSSAGECGFSDDTLANKGIIVGRKGSIGKVYFSNDPFFCIDTAFYIDEVEKSTDLKFIYYYLPMLQLENYNNDAAVPGLNRNLAHNIKIKIPDLETQEKIAQVLSSYDELIENNNRRIELLENMAEEIYREWFVRMRFPGHEQVRFEKGIPEGWEYFKLEDICNLVRGISYSTKDIQTGAGTPMLTLKSINPYGGYNNDGIKYFDGELSDRHLLKPTDILMAITDMTQDRRVIGHVAMIPDFSEKLVFSADLILLKDIKINKYFFYSYLRYGDLSNNIGMFSNGANVLHLNQRILNKIKFIIPSEKLMNEYGDIQKNMVNKINYINKQNQNLIKQRDMLLPRLMNGTIEVK